MDENPEACREKVTYLRLPSEQKPEFISLYANLMLFVLPYHISLKVTSR